MNGLKTHSVEKSMQREGAYCVYYVGYIDHPMIHKSYVRQRNTFEKTFIGIKALIKCVTWVTISIQLMFLICYIITINISQTYLLCIYSIYLYIINIAYKQHKCQYIHMITT